MHSFADRFSTRVQDHVASVTQGVVREDNNNPVDSGGQNDPKKRMVMLTAFLACLSFIIVFANAFMSFIYDVVKEDVFWEKLDDIASNMASTNDCKCKESDAEK